MSGSIELTFNWQYEVTSASKMAMIASYWVVSAVQALRAIKPPSTGIVTPVKNEAAGRHRLSVM